MGFNYIHPVNCFSSIASRVQLHPTIETFFSCYLWYGLMNDLPVIGSRFLRSPRGKHQLTRRKCLAEGSLNVQKNDFSERLLLFRCSQKRSRIYRSTCLPAQGLSWIWNYVIVSKFRKTNHKSPRNNSTKHFQFFGRVLSLLLAFFVACNTRERYKSYLEAAGA